MALPAANVTVQKSNLLLVDRCWQPSIKTLLLSRGMAIAESPSTPCCVYTHPNSPFSTDHCRHFFMNRVTLYQREDRATVISSSSESRGVLFVRELWRPVCPLCLVYLIITFQIRATLWHSMMPSQVVSAFSSHPSPFIIPVFRLRGGPRVTRTHPGGGSIWGCPLELEGQPSPWSMKTKPKTPLRGWVIPHLFWGVILILFF